MLAAVQALTHSCRARSAQVIQDGLTAGSYLRSPVFAALSSGRCAAVEVLTRDAEGAEASGAPSHGWVLMVYLAGLKGLTPAELVAESARSGRRAASGTQGRWRLPGGVLGQLAQVVVMTLARRWLFPWLIGGWRRMA